MVHQAIVHLISKIPFSAIWIKVSHYLTQPIIESNHPIYLKDREVSYSVKLCLFLSFKYIAMRPDVLNLPAKERSSLDLLIRMLMDIGSMILMV